MNIDFILHGMIVGIMRALVGIFECLVGIVATITKATNYFGGLVLWRIWRWKSSSSDDFACSFCTREIIKEAATNIIINTTTNINKDIPIRLLFLLEKGAFIEIKAPFCLS